MLTANTATSISQQVRMLYHLKNKISSNCQSCNSTDAY